MKHTDYTPEENALMGKGFDHAIDMACSHMTKQINALEVAKRENAALNITMTRDVLRHMIEAFKAAKGVKNQQIFNVEEVRAVVDHVTGSVQPTNKATMEYFDNSIMPMLLTGELQLKEFTKLKKNDEPGVSPSSEGQKPEADGSSAG